MPAPSSPPAAAASPGLVRVGLAALAAVGALALVAATFTNVVVVRVAGATRGADTGYDRHGPALLLLAVAVIVLAAVALRGSRVAGVGLTVVGVAVLAIAVLGDVPDLHRTGSFGGAYATAVTAAGAGFYLETLGGALAVLAGAGLWFTGPALAGPSPADARRSGSAQPAPRPPRQT